MGWGTSVRCKVRYKGKVLLSIKELDEEMNSLVKEREEHWDRITKLLTTNPNDWICDMQCYKDYPSVVNTFYTEFDAECKAIEYLYEQEAIVFFLKDSIERYGDDHDDVELKPYGSLRGIKKVINTLCGSDLDFGTESYCYPYVYKQIFRQKCQFIDYMDKHRNYINNWWSSLKVFLLINPNDMVGQNVGDEEYPEILTDLADVIRHIQNEIESYKESMEEDATILCQMKLILNDWDTIGEPYLASIDEKNKLYEEWEKAKDAVCDEVYEKHGIKKTDNLFANPNWKEICEEASKEIEKRGLNERPTNTVVDEEF